MALLQLAPLFVLFIFGTILIDCSNFPLVDTAQDYPFAVEYCTLVSSNSPDIDLCSICQQQADNTMSDTKECWVGFGTGNCDYIKNDCTLGSNDCDTNRPFICNENVAADAAGSAFDMAIIPEDNIGSNELVCVEYKYYMAICVLLMIAFASFLCFIVVALNKLKQLRERSYW